MDKTTDPWDADPQHNIDDKVLADTILHSNSKWRKKQCNENSKPIHFRLHLGKGSGLSILNNSRSHLAKWDVDMDQIDMAEKDRAENNTAKEDREHR